MDIADRDRLLKFIGMLGSEHDGERANAAAFIQRMAERHKMTITELMAAAHGGAGKVIYKDRIVEKPVYRDRVVEKEKVVYRDRPAPEQPKSKSYIMPDDPDAGGFTDVDSPLITRLRMVAAKPAIAARVLSKWELDFTTDVSARYDFDTLLSDKQLEKVAVILNKASRVFTW